MDAFREIHILIKREQKLRRRADYLRDMASRDPQLRRSTAKNGTYEGELYRVEALADKCFKRAREKFWTAQHEAYMEAKQSNLPAYRKRFSNPSQ